MVAAILCAAVLLGAPGAFPVLVDKGQTAAPSSGSSPNTVRYHLTHQLSAVEKLYRDEFRGESTIHFTRGTSESGEEQVTILSRRPGDRWAKAVLTDEGLSTRVEVVPLIVGEAIDVSGRGGPLVAVVLQRSTHVNDQLKAIDADHEAGAHP